MSGKRSRTGRSSSFSDSGIFNRLLPPASADSSNSRLHIRMAFCNGAKVLKPSPEAEKPPSSVLTMSSPEAAWTGHAVQADSVLDHCYFCRKRLPHSADVFMCGPFRAFCSPECRDQQVVMDKISEQPRSLPVQTMYSNVNGS